MRRRLLALLVCLPLFTAALPAAAAEETNVAQGKSYTVFTEAAIENAFPNQVLADAGQLTDGESASDVIGDPNWVQLYRGVFTGVTIDLGEEMAVSGYEMGQLSWLGAGVYLSRYIEFSVSMDGESFYLVHRWEDQKMISSTPNGRVVHSYEGDRYKARYVRLIFSSDVNCFIDEIKVFGGAADGSEKTADVEQKIEYRNAYAPNNIEALGGVSNSILIYNNTYYNGVESDIGKNTYDELLPYIAYVDKNKNLLDTMFDSALFLPLNPGTDGEHSLMKQSGWEHYLENTIGAAEDINMTALDRLVGDIKAELDLGDDFQFPVLMTVPYTSPSTAVFGTLDGSASVSLDTLEGCEAVVEWFVDESIAAFEDADFQNLKLVGFYWYAELVNYAASDFGEALVQSFNAYVHSKDLGTMWIPYYCAPGMERAVELGFDVACVQNGYAFPKEDSENGLVQPGVIADSLDIAYRYGLGAEIELQLVEDYFDRYSEYISGNYQAGVMTDSFTAFYQGGGPGALYTCAFGNNKQRAVYDMTYMYIKDTYEEFAPVIEQDGPVYFLKDSTKNSGTLVVTDGDTPRTELTIAYLEEPSHGKLTIDADGYFLYVPDTGYTGDDSFVIEISDGKHSTGRVTIQLKIVETLMPLSKAGSALTGTRIVRFADKASTQTAGDGIYEVAVSAEGKVISAAYANDTAIPEGGYVIAAIGDEKVNWLSANAVVGCTAIYDAVTNSIVFEVGPDEGPDDGADNTGTILLVCAVLLVVIAAAVIIIVMQKRKKRGQQA